MVRILYQLFGIVAYLIFFATFLYLIGFLADLHRANEHEQQVDQH